MSAMRHLLLACAAALLVASAHAGSGYATSLGVADCGKLQTRAIVAGDSFSCCSDWSKDFIMGYEYTVTGLTSDDNVDYKISAFGTTYSDSICNVSSNGTNCDGEACGYSWEAQNSCSTGDQKMEDNTDNSTAMCFTATCNNNAGQGACAGMRIEIKFATRLPDPTPLYCPTCSLENINTGSCGLFSKEKADTWCTHEGDVHDPIFGEIFSGDKICCATSSTGCCDPDSGAIAGVAIGLIIGLSLLILLCCACCSGCPCHKRLCCYRPPPFPQGVAMAPMQGYPQAMAPMQAGGC